MNDDESLGRGDPRPARIQEVAKAAGVSTATVSRALSAPNTVRPATRERVIEAARRLNYTPNEAARALRAGSTRMVLVAVPDVYSGAFFDGVLNAIDVELSAHGYTMILGSLEGDEEKARRLVELVYARQIDGVIILSNCAGAAGRKSVFDAGVPIVAVCAEVDRPGHPTILVDDRACAIAQTRHLIEFGHRRLLYVSGIADHYNEIHRYRGFRDAVADAGIADAEVRRFVGDYSLRSGVEAARFFLAQSPRPTGVVCCSDEMAIGFLKTATSAGVKAPQDVSIVGFDDIEFAQFCEPALTTIRQPRDELGAAGARTLLRCLSGQSLSCAPIVVEGQLVVRGSTGPAPRFRRSFRERRHATAA